jgi:hypothetical protein
MKNDDDARASNEEAIEELAPTHLLIEPAPSHLSHEHRETLERVFAHPTSGNIEWRQVRSLLTTRTHQKRHARRLPTHPRRLTSADLQGNLRREWPDVYASIPSELPGMP